MPQAGTGGKKRIVGADSRDCAAPSGLLVFLLRDPALTGWAKACRASGAGLQEFMVSDTPSPNFFSQLRILKDLQGCVFGTARSKALSVAFCVTAHFKGVSDG